MQQTTGVAVLATELPATDRRALSQAWYSALHLAQRAPRARSAPPPSTAQAHTTGAHGGARDAHRGAGGNDPTALVTVRRDARARRDASAQRDASAIARDGMSAWRDPNAGAERRAPKSELARRIERTLAQRPCGVPASFAVSAAGGRVRILVRSDGTRTRVVAVCALPLRERVERALAEARFALAARGMGDLRAEVA